jgi:hypothetical protein
MPALHRLFAASLLAFSALSAVATAHAAPEVRGRDVSIGAADAQQFLEGQFPQQRDALGGLVELTVSRPRLELPPGNRLRLAFDLAMASGGGTPTPVGNVTLSSALRYDGAQQAFFLDQPSLEAFKPVSGSATLDPSTRSLLNAWLADYARQEPVYRLDPAIAALLGGIQVASAGVADGRLVVTFNQDIGALAPQSLD